MDNYKRKRGPKASGEKKIGVFRRLPDDLLAKVDAFIDKAIEAKHEGNLAAIDSWLKGTYGVSGVGPEPQMACNAKEEASNVIVASKPLHPEYGLSVLVKKPDPDVKALLDDVERLTKERDYWAERFNKAAAATDGQKGAYWKGRFEEVAAKLAKVEQERHG